ncbi:hypothetical protein EIP86_003592 [Pleurotus ostreatoroseus]|nr:hypothetical protein EIP86_003592 [Pleurotus ostreatoroseus]
MARKPSTRRLSLKDEAAYPPTASTQHPQGRPSQARLRKCELTFPDGILSVVKGADNIWRCPRCKAEFGSVARDLKNHEQEHASSGSCMARPRGGAVRQSASNVRLRIGPLRATGKTAEVEFIARRTRPDGQGGEEDEDTFDMNEVVMKLEDDDEMDGVSEQMSTEVPKEVTVQDHSLDDEHDHMQNMPMEATDTALPVIDAAERRVQALPEINEAAQLAAPNPIPSLTPNQEQAGADNPPMHTGLGTDVDTPEANVEAPLLLSPSSRIESFPSASFSISGSSSMTLETPRLTGSSTMDQTCAVAANLPSHTPKNTASYPIAYPDTLPHALKAFLETLTLKRDFLPEIFIQWEIDSEEALDLLCQSAQEEEFRDFIQAVKARSPIVSLAVKKGLRERAEALKKAETSVESG